MYFRSVGLYTNQLYEANSTELSALVILATQIEIHLFQKYGNLLSENHWC